jgi:hypothetical protein
MHLGRRLDPERFAPTGEKGEIEADRLVRHAVCIGMTGSGKTGLCIGLLEEAALAGVPILAIDPKGDLANLALAFRDHRGADFERWVDPDEAARQGTDVGKAAAALAEKWRAGLEASGVEPARSAAFAETVQVTVHTPGSLAGVPIDVLGAIRGPPIGAAPEDEAWNDAVNGAVGALLGLVGRPADPIRDPAHLVLARIASDAWAAGEPLDLERLVVRLVDPPFPKVGVFPVDTFFPRAERLDLAMSLNAVAASPSFAAWSQGTSLDLDVLLDRSGKTPIRVLYLAHLDDAQRLFFLTLLLHRIVAWARRLPGTGALRALVYFDEVYGYLPPHPRDPPTRRPLLTLLKQARAVGVGVVLATQNPIDLDYSALSNAGLWFVGRLSTAQDRARALDGIASAGGGADPAALGRIVESLPARAFLVRDVSAPAPWVLGTRHTLSWLRGPLTLREIERLRGTSRIPDTPAPARATRYGPPDDLAGTSADPPPAPAGFDYRFLDPAVVFSARLGDRFAAQARAARADGVRIWEPALHAHVRMRFDEGREFVSEREEHRLWFPLTGAGLGAPDDPPFEPGDFLPSPPPGGRFAPLPALVDEARELVALGKRVVDELLRTETDAMWTMGDLSSRAGETEAAFRARAEAVVQDRIDAAVAKLKGKVEGELARITAARDRLVRDRDTRAAEARQRQVSEVVSAGETLWGLFFGRRSAGTAATRALRYRQATTAANDRAARVDQDLADLDNKEFDLETRLRDEIAAIEVRERRALDAIAAVPVRLDKEDVRVERFGVIWIPVTRDVGPAAG